MRSRAIPFAISWALALSTVGCNQPAIPPIALAPAGLPASTKPTPSVQMQPLTADQIAQILGVNAWTAKFSGGAVEVWLEIEETGQSTLPRRIPEKGFLGIGPTHPATEGTIEFWWTRREDRAGGALTVNSGNGSYTLGLAKDAFTFAWPGFGARTTTVGKGELVPGEPGQEFVILDYDATEMPRDGESKSPRRVHLKLMGRFAVAK